MKKIRLSFSIVDGSEIRWIESTEGIVEAARKVMSLCDYYGEKYRRKILIVMDTGRKFDASGFFQPFLEAPPHIPWCKRPWLQRVFGREPERFRRYLYYKTTDGQIVHTIMVQLEAATDS